MLWLVESIVWSLFYLSTLVVWGLGLPAPADFTAVTWLGVIPFLGGSAFLIWALVTHRTQVSMGVKASSSPRDGSKRCLAEHGA